MTPFAPLTPDQLRDALTQQGERLLDAQQAATRWQLEQAEQARTLGLEAATKATEASLKAWKDSADALFAMQQKWVEAVSPAKAEA